MAETSSQRVREVIEAGAAGFVPKSYRLEEIEAVLRIVLRHRVYLPAEFLISHELTQRGEAEGETQALAIRGVPVKLISRQLGIAEGTVKVHLSMVYRALGARNRTDALCRVFEAQAAAALEAP